MRKFLLSVLLFPLTLIFTSCSNNDDSTINPVTDFSIKSKDGRYKAESDESYILIFKESEKIESIHMSFEILPGDDSCTLELSSSNVSITDESTTNYDAGLKIKLSNASSRFYPTSTAPCRDSDEALRLLFGEYYIPIIQYTDSNFIVGPIENCWLGKCALVSEYISDKVQSSSISQKLDSEIIFTLVKERF